MNPSSDSCRDSSECTGPTELPRRDKFLRWCPSLAAIGGGLVIGGSGVTSLPALDAGVVAADGGVGGTDGTVVGGVLIEFGGMTSDVDSSFVVLWGPAIGAVGAATNSTFSLAAAHIEQAHAV